MKEHQRPSPQENGASGAGKRFFRVFFSAAGVLLLSKALGFVKQMATASAFGADAETDLINLAAGFIGNSQYLLVQALLTAFLPVYIHIRDEREAGRFASDALKAVAVIASGAIGAILLAAPLAARLIASSYGPEASRQLAMWLRLLSPALLLFLWIAVFQSLLDAHQRFLPGQLEGLNQSVIFLLLLPVLAPRLGPRTLAVGLIIYTAWNAVFLGALGWKYRSPSRGNPFRNPAVRELLRMMAPMLLAQSLVYVNQLVDKSLASGLPAGTVTAMSYAGVLSNLVGTFVTTFCSMLFSYITAQISQGDEEGAARLTVRSASLLILAFLPVSVLTVLCAEDIVTVVYARGAFGRESVRHTAAALRGYGLMFVPLAFRDLFSRFQYSYKDTRRPMINSAVSIALNIALSVALCPRLGVFGITLATSVSVLLCGLLNLTSARRHNAALSFRPLMGLLPWAGAGGVLCALAARWVITGPLAGSAPLLRFTLAALLGFGAFLPFAALPLWKLLRGPRK